jgi:hypothetical protein
MNTIQKEYEELMKRNQATIEWLVKHGYRKESSLSINELEKPTKNKW